MPTNVAKTQDVPLDRTIFFGNTGQRDKTNWLMARVLAICYYVINDVSQVVVHEP